MKRFWLLVLVCVSFNSLGSQEVKHAPTVECCRADQQLWLAKLEQPNDGTATVGYNELSGWFREMKDCRKVDPDSELSYYNTTGEINSELIMRLVRFLGRHHLWDQFLAEDAQGKR